MKDATVTEIPNSEQLTIQMGQAAWVQLKTKPDWTR
jgi:hypothetical protein